MLNSLIPRCSVLIYEKDSILRKQHGLLVIARGSTKCVFDDVDKFNFYSSFFSETYLKTADRLVQDAVAAVQTAAAATNNRSEEAKKKCIRSSRSTTPKPARGTAHIRLKRRPL